MITLTPLDINKINCDIMKSDFWGVDFNQLSYAVPLANGSETVFGHQHKSLPLIRLRT